MAQLTDGVQYLKGIGPAKAKLFEALGIRTIGDLLYHYPRTYEDRTKLVPIASLEVGQPACFRAMVMTSPGPASSGRDWNSPRSRWRTTPPG